MGVAAAVVVAQSAAGAQRFVAAHPLSFPVLSDPTRAVIKAYGVYHLLGLDAFRMARPALFALTHAGAVQFAHVSANQVERLPETAILRAAAQVQTGGSS